MASNDGSIVDKLEQVHGGSPTLLHPSFVRDWTHEFLVELNEGQPGGQPGSNVEKVLSLGACQEGSIEDMVCKDHVEGRFGIEEEEVERGVGDVEGV